MSEVALRRLQDWSAEMAIVLGSGLSALVENIEPVDRVAYSEFAALPPAPVPGHSGEFVLGEVNGKAVLFAKGRAHLYEGHSARAVTAAIRILADARITRVVLTNAAGTANPGFAPGSWMMLRDHLNLTGASPLLGAAEFVDMTDTYSKTWRSCFAQAAGQTGVTLHEGVYAGLLGPQYETPAEVRMLRQLGADAIGMSTVLEAIQARALGLEVAGFSCLTNWAAGLGDDHASHEEVLSTAKASAAELFRLLAAAIR